MNKMQALAKVLMAVLGLYILFCFFNHAGAILGIVQYGGLAEIINIKFVISVIISILYLAILFRHNMGRFFASKINHYIAITR